MKNSLFTALATLLSITFTLAQPTIQWQKSFGGSGGDYAISIQQTIDGGYVVAGLSNSNDSDVSGNHGSNDYWVVKLNNTGTIEWQKSLGGTDVDEAASIQQTNDGGYIIAGSSNSIDGDVSGNHGNYDYWMVKLSSLGTIEWQKSLGGTYNDQAQSIQQTIDGGYIVAGYSYSNDGDVSGNHGAHDYWVVKLNNTGTLDWQKSLGGTGSDQAASIQQTIDGGYIIAGRSTSNDFDVSGNHGGQDYWVVKLTNIGTIEWQKSLGGTDADFAFSVQQSADGGYIVAGYSYSNDGDVSVNYGGYDYWMVKLSSLGSLEWQISLGGWTEDGAHSIIQTNDGGYIIAGKSFSNYGIVSGNHGYSDYWVVKLTNLGSFDWQKSLGGTGYESARSIQQTNDGGYIVSGYSKSNDGDVMGNHGDNDYWVVKLDNCQLTISNEPESQTMNVNSISQFTVSASNSLAIFQWQSDLGVGFQNLNSIGQYSGTSNDTLTISNVTLTNNNQPFRCIISSGSCSDTSAIAVLTVLNNIGINEVSEFNLFSVYPNPAQHVINVKADAKLLESVYTIYDNTGKVVQSGKITSEDTAIEIGSLTGGIYLFSVGENLKQTFKVIKQ
jgi:hypothetical protein